MNSIQSSLYTAAVALCLFSAGLLRHTKSRPERPFAFFTAFLVIESLGFVFELLMVHPAVPLKALWLGLRMSASLLVAPCLWLAVREIVEGTRPRLSSLGRRQIGLIGVGFALTVPLIQTAHLGLTYYDPNHIVSALHSRMIHGTMLLCIAIFGWQVPFYLWRCRRLLLMQLDRQKSANQDGGVKSVAWLHFPLVLVFTTWILGLLRTVQCASHAPQEFTVLFSFTDVSVTVAAIYLMMRRAASPELRLNAVAQKALTSPESACEITSSAVALTVCPALPVETAALAPVPVSHRVAAVESFSAPLQKTKAVPVPLVAKCEAPVIAAIRPEAKYRKSNLPAAARDRIKRKLEAALSNREFYQDSLLNLRSLSAGIKENAHYVSQVINQELDSSFYQLVSRHRIDQAKKLLVGARGQTVLEIALAVGFNSKSTFNTAFRRNTGMTPSAFRANAVRKR